MSPRVLLSILVLDISGCAGPAAEHHLASETGPRNWQAAATDRVLRADETLSTTRNHACETAPLTQAILGYVQGLDALDFEGCATDFVGAFARHRDAWNASIPFFEGYSELRGEMHDLFEQIRASNGDARDELEAIEAEIWGTWAAVEATLENP